MKTVVFVGERRSATAKRMGVRWEDGRLAAKQLFDAFAAVGFDRKHAEFINVATPGSKTFLESRYDDGFAIVAMGDKVQERLTAWDIKHIGMVHPAARGKIRSKNRYAAEVRRALKEASVI